MRLNSLVLYILLVVLSANAILYFAEYNDLNTEFFDIFLGPAIFISLFFSANKFLFLADSKCFSNRKRRFDVSPTARSIKEVTLLIALVIIYLILSYIGFVYKVAVVGLVADKALPYKINGAMYYSVKYALPFSIIFVYMRFFRNSVKTECFILIIGFVSALLTASRFSLLLFVLPIFLNNIKSRTKLVIFSCCALYMYTSVTLARYLIYEYAANDTLSDCGIYCVLGLALPFTRFSTNELFYPVTEILSRFDSLSTLSYASKYNIENVNSIYDSIFRIGCQYCFPLDVDLHHLEWQGFLSPPGIVNNGGILSLSVEIANYSMFALFFFAIICSAVVGVYYKILCIFVRTYDLDISVTYFLSVLLAILFVTDPGGIALLVCVAFLFILPQITKIRIGT